jgi:hypothetical protein
MDNFIFELLALISFFLYTGIAVFFWAIFKENCSAYNKSLVGENFTDKNMGRSPYPTTPNLRNFLTLNWKPLAFSGLIFFGVFVFFITHVCDYT